MMTVRAVRADEWRARFAEQRWRAERDELWARIGGERESDSERRSSATVVLRPAHEAGSVDIPVSAARVETAALAAGWAARVVRSVAAVPRTGILRVVTVRGSRHDERFWAAWWQSGDKPASFECAQYLVRGSAIERLGFRTTKTRRGVLDAIEGRRLE